MLVLALATACAGIFFGAALYINLVEHPARVSCGTELAVREFGPSYQRAARMQGGLAVLGCLVGLGSAWAMRDVLVAAAAVLLGSWCRSRCWSSFPPTSSYWIPAWIRAAAMRRLSSRAGIACTRFAAL